MRDITSLRQEFLSILVSLNLVPRGTTPSSPVFNTHSSRMGLVKSIILAGLWPRVSRVHLPRGAIKFDRVQAGTVQRANEAKEYKLYDVRVGEDGGRVFLHPASVLFHSAEWKSQFVAYFQKQQTTKLFLRDATEVRYAPRSIKLKFTCLRLDPNLLHALVRRTCRCEPCWGRFDRRQQRRFREAKGMATHRRAR